MEEKKLKPVITDFNRDDPLAPTTKKETQRAQKALRDYAFMKMRRSLRGLLAQYQKEKEEKKAIPTDSFTTLSQWSVMFMWQERVAAFDEIERMKEQAEFSEAQAKWRANRRQVVQVAFTKVAEALRTVETDKVTLRDIANALKVINQELRLEYQDTAEKSEDGSIIITQTGTITPTIIKIIKPVEENAEDND